jgi:hypothetical protein
MGSNEPQTQGKEPQRTAQIVLTFDLDTLTLSIAGSVPSNQVSLDMAHRFLDETKRIVDAEWNKQRGLEVKLAGAIPAMRWERG